MISIRSLTKSFGEQALFKNVSLQINAGDRFAIVGPNGAGKSTLFKILLGQEEPDSGTVELKGGVSIGYLPQEPGRPTSKPVLDETLTAVEHPSGQTEARAKEILMGLGFAISDFARPVDTLSGGWAMRVSIAKLLLAEPDLLLLDEPTNHLDLQSLLWFQDWLQHWRGAILLISHDRDFVDNVTGAIVSLEYKTMRVYYGNYQHFLDEYSAARERLAIAFRDQQNEIKRMQEFIFRNRARMSTATRAQSVQKKLDKMELIELPPDNRAIKISFPQPQRTGLKALSLKNVSKAYGSLKVYENFSYELERGQKQVFVGRNGAGKSTLLKMLAGVLEPDSGEREPGLNVRVGYYSQHRLDMLDPERTALAEALDTGRINSELLVRTILGSFLFSGDAVFKKVKYLSGGEKSRLALVKLLLNPPNVLLLDEPTTHLDLTSVQVLANALKEFDGTLCFISHDVYFINEVANSVVHVEGGKVTHYPGNYDYYVSRQEAGTHAVADLNRRAEQPEESGSKAERAAKKERERNIRRLESDILRAEEELEHLSGQLADPAVYGDFNKLRDIGDRMQELQDGLAQMHQQYQSAAEKA
ncbi:MAG: ABC-F family ATP-binding cassette domain-containing protein [Elusimicrobia bacterium]|nr:ABC-F family ATP-binding cassette domain-containing protein [Elusimicrobiota bacterium]